jgi:hypothetical protein
MRFRGIADTPLLLLLLLLLAPAPARGVATLSSNFSAGAPVACGQWTMKKGWYSPFVAPKGPCVSANLTACCVALTAAVGQAAGGATAKCAPARTACAACASF